MHLHIDVQNCDKIIGFEVTDKDAVIPVFCIIIIILFYMYFIEHSILG